VRLGSFFSPSPNFTFGDIVLGTKITVYLSLVDSCTTASKNVHTMSQKHCAKLFLPELSQMSTNFDNFWQIDGKEAEIMQDVLIFHLI